MVGGHVNRGVKIESADNQQHTKMQRIAMFVVLVCINFGLIWVMSGALCAFGFEYHGPGFNIHCNVRIRRANTDNQVRVQYHGGNGISETTVEFAGPSIDAQALKNIAEKRFGLSRGKLEAAGIETTIVYPPIDPIPAGETAVLGPVLPPHFHDIAIGWSHEEFCTNLRIIGWPDTFGMRAVRYVVPPRPKSTGAFNAARRHATDNRNCDRAWIAREIPEGILLMVENPAECRLPRMYIYDGDEPRLIRMPGNVSRFVWLATGGSVWSVPQAYDDMLMRADLFSAEFAAGPTEYKYDGLSWRECPSGYEVFEVDS